MRNAFIFITCALLACANSGNAQTEPSGFKIKLQLGTSIENSTFGSTRYLPTIGLQVHRFVIYGGIPINFLKDEQLLSRRGLQLAFEVDLMAENSVFNLAPHYSINRTFYEIKTLLFDYTSEGTALPSTRYTETRIRAAYIGFSSGVVIRERIDLRALVAVSRYTEIQTNLHNDGSSVSGNAYNYDDDEINRKYGAAFQFQAKYRFTLYNSKK